MTAAAILIHALKFPDTAATNVHGVFKNIIGGDSVNYAKLLADIVFKPDFLDAEGFKSCTDPIYMGATRDGDSDHPKVITCDSGFKHGSIRKAVRDAPKEVTCKTIGKTTSWRMDTVGSIILHEYM